MLQKAKKPAPPCQAATGLGVHTMPTVCIFENTPSLSALQAAFLARLGLDATRARLTAELAGWRS